MRSRVSTTIAGLVAVLMLALAAPVFAQTSPTQQVYAPTGEVKEVIGGGGGGDVIPPPTSVRSEGSDEIPTPTRPSERVEAGGNVPVPSAGGSLPFTGFEAGLVALAGLALLGTGFALRRAARPVA